MNKIELAVVMTTIQAPTTSMQVLARALAGHAAALFVVGDKKGPMAYDLPGTRFLSLQAQLDGPFRLAKALPTGHYTRKNVGYLAAIAAGAPVLYETDDDNAPLPSWHPRARDVQATSVTDRGWVNAYRCFTDGRIWPRGFPLDGIVASVSRPPLLARGASPIKAPIQQGLANNSPDVDAVWRLVLDEPFDFEQRGSIHLPPGAWCPFNSQTTWWWPDAYPLLYLPSHCSFRMTDIWRSFIAQRCLWEMGHGIVFHAPEVVQERNPHVLMRDFEDEIPGYRRNRELAAALEETTLLPGVSNTAANLRACYSALVAKDFFPTQELALVDAWLRDLEECA